MHCITMLTTLKSKGLLWPAIMAVAGVAILIALGTWQMQRLAWKQGLLADISQRAHGDPVAATRAEQSKRAGADVEYLRVKIGGQFLHDKERHLFAFDSKYGPGYHIFTPLKRADGSIAFVNRGFVPSELRDPAKRDAGQVAGEVEIVGLVRGSEKPRTFTPENNVADNIWHWRDLDGMAVSVFGQEAPRLIPFFIDAEAESRVSGAWPKGGVTRLELPNRHLEYAITWYGLAAALIAVFAAYAVSRWRHPDA
ncbi:MAG: SURF1 family protein [Hyphomicrobium sp.]